MTGNEAAKINSDKKRFQIPIFLRRGRIAPFLTVVLAGQLTYSAFEAFKGSLMLPLTEALGISIGQFGVLMGWLGIAMFLYVPGGWVNNRFTIRQILVAWAGWRLITGLALFTIPGLSFNMMIAIAISWGVWDAIGWPAVVNGVAFLSQDQDKEGRGLAMGLLESIRRAVEFLMNAAVIGLLAVFAEHATTVMRIAAITYTLILIPLILAILKFVPKNATAAPENEDDTENKAALRGLAHVLIKPRVWMAGVAAMCVYWCYVNLIYSSAPYLQLVYNANAAQAGAFGIFNTGLVGIFAGLIAGLLADYVFKSSTRMMGVSLTIIALGTIAIFLMPGAHVVMAMLLLIVMAFGVFMGKAVILAPIAELQLPESINGSAMAVGSFLAYASIFWANPLTAGLVERAGDNPAAGYQQVFMITIIVSLVGAAAAWGLDFLNRREARKTQ
ncbi:putative MFS family arabinose efflux permease [Trueperella bonasi]|uniref:MFS family arabinose efflux permease n=1 Tax=Trueperella bonasi TaxID=312286 RepID=A0ABT9NGK7_9ACTO|nr:MFS transporter [Trueperella bonasi]MDP9806539.1 putative MFS family arabinose efflux permease [Trueperella bonasi]